MINAIQGGTKKVPLWFSAWSAAKDWGVPPWVIMGEKDNDWTKIKWLMRHNFINEQVEKLRKREEAKARRKNK